ncbi:hypothetical protein FA95DRAFT_1563431 [Auriscalpium vulgare]|uniref:Uncharacterized protein n=1 Tax=Auriscalpium vulgare TaxID=40419 RepID=A0ACB8RGL0_9AGAM|nr:hypothetical protein FA95DRAFT_1563431 [Auriscalpium vulgare]
MAKEQASPNCLPICGPLGDRMKGVHRAVRWLASKTLRRAHRGRETDVSTQSPPDPDARSRKHEPTQMFETLRLRMTGKNHSHITLSLPSFTGQHREKLTSSHSPMPMLRRQLFSMLCSTTQNVSPCPILP